MYIYTCSFCNAGNVPMVHLLWHEFICKSCLEAKLKLLNDDEIREKYEREWATLGEMG